MALASDTGGMLAVETTRRLVVRGVLAIAALSLACNMGVLAGPFFNMQVFNRVLATRNLDTLAALATGLAVCLVAYAVLDVLRGMALEALAAKATRRLSLPLLRAVSAAGQGPGAVNQALSDLETLRGFVASPACTAPLDAAWAPVMLLILLVQHWAFAALGLLCCVVLVVMNLLGDALSHRGMRAANEASVAAMRLAADAVGAAEAVVGLGMMPTLARRWQERQRHSGGLAHRALLRARGTTAATTTLRMGMTAAMVALGLTLAIDGHVTGGAMVAGNMILARLLLPFQQIASTRRRWVDTTAAWRRIEATLRRAEPARYDHPMPAPAGRLVVENASYYPPGGARILLRGVSFSAEPGETVGIIGPSSSGKTTLVRLIMGLMPPSAGGVFLDGTSTYLWQREDFARHVGYVPQGLALLDETVADTIARLQAPRMSAVLDAAKRAGIHGAIARLPFGYATRLSGGVLSTGQRQRLALARALYDRPSLLVLDEPTAFLDKAGEADVLELLAELRRQGTTVLLITHRPALLATADKLLVLKDGATAQFGVREDVLKSIAPPPVRLVRAAPAEHEAVS